MKTIYFAGSIRGGREKQQTYHQIIQFLKEKNRVLTELIGSEMLTDQGEGQSDREIFLRDIHNIDLCDIVIAECTTPSLGVGYELAYAEKRRKKVLVLYEQCGKKLSAMVSGNPYFHTIYYANLGELQKELTAFGL